MSTSARATTSLLLVGAIAAIAVTVAWLTSGAGRDGAFTIESFDREVELARDGELAVTETIVVRFHEGRRGIFRDLPPDGPSGRVVYGEVAVDQGDPSQPWNAVRERAPNGDVRIRIGDPMVTLSPGRYTYRLRFTIQQLTFRAADDPGRVQLRLDVPGYEWPTDVETTTLTVRSPAAISSVSCVAGPRRTVRRCDPPPTIEGGAVVARFDGFGPGQAATVAIDLDGRAFADTLPVFADQPLESRSGLPVWPLPAVPAMLLMLLVFALPFLVFELVKARLVYRDVVTDPHLHDRAQPTVRFAPPDGMRPYEVAGVLRRTSNQSLLLGTLVDQDQRGLIHSEMSGSGSTSVVTFSPGGPDIHAVPAEAAFLRALLPSGNPTRFDGSYDPASARRIDNATKQIVATSRRVLEDRGCLHGRGGLLRSTVFKALLLVIALVYLAIASLLAVLTLPSLFFVAVIVGAALVVLGWVGLRELWEKERLPLNSRGRDTIAQAEAFEEFIKTVEAEQLEWAADQPGIDHHHPALSLLPYAIVLGHATSWYHRFGSVIRQLAAATAAAGASAGGIWWSTQLGYSRTESAHSGTVTSPSSSGGGSFGGGGGGSGGGGGGGGSW